MRPEELTPEAIDREFPLQQPDGVAMSIKHFLDVGQPEQANIMLINLRAADQGTVEQAADGLAERHFPDGFSLDVMRAIRLGVAEGMRIGRHEGAEVVKIVTEGQTALSPSETLDPRYDSGATGADGSGNDW